MCAVRQRAKIAPVKKPNVGPNASARGNPEAARQFGIALRTPPENENLELEEELEAVVAWEEGGEEVAAEIEEQGEEDELLSPFQEDFLLDEDDLEPENLDASFGELLAEDHRALDAEGNPQSIPLPSIVINEFGEVVIPLESHVCRLLAVARRKAPKLGKRLELFRRKAALLRAVGELIVASNRSILLGGPIHFAEVRLQPLLQKDVLPNLQASNRSLLVSASFVKTPLWGIVPLAAFFGESPWAPLIAEARQILEEEAYDNPFTSRFVWETMLKKHQELKRYHDERMLRNELAKAGIPLHRGRKEIYTQTLQWITDNASEQTIRPEDVEAVLHRVLAKMAKIKFKSAHQSQYEVFIRERITKILEARGVTVSDGATANGEGKKGCSKTDGNIRLYQP